MLWVIVIALAGVLVWKGSGAHLFSKKVACPSCDLYIHRVRLRGDGAVLCPHCRAYATISDGALTPTAPDRIAARPVFCAELPDGVRWPEGCSVCGAPATRAVPVRLIVTQDAAFHKDMATRLATLGLFTLVERTTFTLPIPHCEDHTDGAELVMPAESEQLNPGIVFRSYPYYTRFVQANRVSPRRSSRFGPDAGGV
jgi:hypothetical protein